MTFFKRHWPDMLISALILALLGGFASILLGGQHGGRSQGPATLPTTSAPSTTQATTGSKTSGPGKTTPPVTAQPEANVPGPPETASTEEDLPTIPDGGTATGKASAGQPQGAQTAPATTETQPDSSGASAVPSPPVTDQDPASPPSQDGPGDPASAPPVPTSSNDTPTRADYRLSAGLFSSEAVARERTAAIAALHYTVHLIPVEGGVVAQVGPFADRDSAERAAQAVRKVYPSLALYPPRVRDQSAEAATTTPASTTNTNPASESGQPQPPQGKTVTEPSSKPASSARPAEPVADVPVTPVYLQVGAYDRQERAAIQVERLRQAGFTPEVIAPAGGQVRVTVGPFSGDALVSAESKLSSLGIDHFRVR